MNTRHLARKLVL